MKILSEAERKILERQCLPFLVTMIFYENPQSRNRCRFRITVQSPDADKAKVVAARMFAIQCPRAGLVIETTAEAVKGKGTRGPLVLSPSTLASLRNP